MLLGFRPPPSAPSEPPGLLERALGAYLGFAVGDALGGTVEFMTAGEIKHKYGSHNRMIGGGWLSLRPGQVTDDTEMSVAVGQSILRCRDFVLKDVADAFAAWLRTRPIDVGNTCRRGIRRYITTGALESPPSDGDGGNGAFMRNLPVALATLHDDESFVRWSVAQCHLTHNHPLSDAATLAFGRMVQLLLNGAGPEAVRAEAERLAENHRQFRFENYRGPSSAYIVDTTCTVFHHYFRETGYRDCVVATINQGGDADTTGALAGMLAGATWGVNSIPKEWLFRLEASVTAEIRRQVDGLLEFAAGGK